MMHFILLFIAFVNAQTLYGNETQIDHCIRQYQQNCETCIPYHQRVYNKEKHIYECKFIDHCISYSSTKSTCKKCVSGYRVDLQSGLCEPGTEYGFYVSNREEYQCVEGSTRTPNGCRKCDNLPHCIESHLECAECNKCENGYKVQNGQCVQNEQEKPHVAVKCKPNENLIDGKCVLNVRTNCALYDFVNTEEQFNQNSVERKEKNYRESVCVECNNGYILKGGECVQNNGFNNCLELAIDGKKCVKCKRGFGLASDGKCNSCGQNCLNCLGSSASCSKCDKGYKNRCQYVADTLDANGKMKYKYICSQCYKMPDHCDLEKLEYNATNKVFVFSGCGVCETGYAKTNQNTCVKCSRDFCGQMHYHNLGNQCSDYCKTNPSALNTYIPHQSGDCKSYANSNQRYGCAVCYPHFYLTKNYRCEPCQDQNKLCAHSATNYIEEGDIKIIDNCAIYKNDHVNCAQCDVGFELQNGKCVNLFQPENMKCNLTDADGFCNLCYDEIKEDYFIPKDFKCAKGDIATQGTNGVMILFVALILLFVF